MRRIRDKNRIIVEHWRYEPPFRSKYVIEDADDGAEGSFRRGVWREEPNPIKPGWHCFAYPTYVMPEDRRENQEFNLETWMSENMTGEYECIMRFNSGDPMHTIFIKESRDAEFFALNFC